MEITFHTMMRGYRELVRHPSEARLFYAPVYWKCINCLLWKKLLPAHVAVLLGNLSEVVRAFAPDPCANGPSRTDDLVQPHSMPLTVRTTTAGGAHSLCSVVSRRARITR